MIFFSCSKEKIDADILIINGTVYNGVDSQPTNNSIAIKGDKIVFIGDENTVELKQKILLMLKDLLFLLDLLIHTHMLIAI